ncbi:hypothetical protein L1787_12390 [Acuticoccus sp. M5D2P5]|uniref:hypothetical protein n=1 Tax=Acuticoccus kalidii TaxID=2910977 RepID=UPI001F2449ED|nr:hypothetical protein [Acuticoccus kalidii]MCF3934206.1 hypothetical protein [Acuticoccus kalidii]
MVHRILIAAATVCASAALSLASADAKQARCLTTDNGSYPCTFEQFGGDGSFDVSAPMKPTYTIMMFDQGVADGFADYGDRKVPLPGPFYRSNRDRACWVSDSTDFAICVY